MTASEIKDCYERMLKCGVPEAHCGATHAELENEESCRWSLTHEEMADHLTMHGLRWLAEKGHFELRVSNNIRTGLCGWLLFGKHDGPLNPGYSSGDRAHPLLAVTEAIESIAPKVQVPDSDGWWLRQEGEYSQCYWVQGDMASHSRLTGEKVMHFRPVETGPDVTWTKLVEAE